MSGNPTNVPISSSYFLTVVDLPLSKNDDLVHIDRSNYLPGFSYLTVIIEIGAGQELPVLCAIA